MVRMTIDFPDKLYGELVIAANRDGKPIEKFIVDVLFDCDVADME